MTTARQIESLVLRALAEKGQSSASSTTGVSETKISRWKQDGGLSLAEVSALLSALGLALIDTTTVEVVTVAREELDALRVLARRALQ